LLGLEHRQELVARATSCGRFTKRASVRVTQMVTHCTAGRQFTRINYCQLVVCSVELYQQ